ncbi:hypothetical protein B447_15726 [Thauera sp. 27]|nr:hypothetical protein B447_15726 [Thauera sp. 27]
MGYLPSWNTPMKTVSRMRPRVGLRYSERLYSEIQIFLEGDYLPITTQLTGAGYTILGIAFFTRFLLTLE